jgi:type IV pilus assembly protein PilM
MHMPPVFFSPRAIVLDCGSTRTALGVFRRKAGRLYLDRYGVETFSKPAGSQDDWLENTHTALQSLRDRVQADGPVVLVPPAHAILTKLVKAPLVEPAQREKIIRFEAGQNIPYALADVVWDSIVVNQNDREMEVLLAAAKLDLVEPLCLAAQAAGFQPALVLPPLLGTLAGFRLAHPDQTGSSLVLNLGVGSVTLLLAEPGRFAGRTFSLGSSAARPLGENPDGGAGEGETIKPADGPADLRAAATENLPTRLLQEITRSVLHFRGQDGMQNPGRVYLTGEGAQLPGLGDVLAAKLRIPVDRLDLLGTIGMGRDVTRNEVTGQALALTDLIGAAAAQLQPAQPALNLLPPRRRQLVRLRQRQPWLMAAAVLMVAALLPPLVHFHRITVEARERTAGIEREIAPWRERAARNRARLQQLEAVRRQITGLQSVHDRRARWLGLLADLQERLVQVEDVWLEKLQIAPGPAGTPLRLLVSGRMLDKANPLSKVSPETYSRVKTLLASVVDSPSVGAVEAARFDNSQPGILKFDFVIVTNPQRPL